MSHKTVSALTAAIFALSSSLAFAGTDTAPAAPATAAAPAQQGALAPGAAAGTKAAEMFEGNTGLYVALGVVVVGGGIALIASNNGGGHSSGSTSTEVAR